MALFDNFINLFQRNNGMSRELRSRLRSTDKDKARRMLIDLNLQTERLTRQDIGAWLPVTHHSGQTQEAG